MKSPKLVAQSYLWPIEFTAHSYGFAGVTNDRVGPFFRRQACAAVGRDKDNAERAFRQHAGKLAGAPANRQRLFGFIPREWNGGEDALFVIVIVVLVFVERELAIRPR
jgi:hypothetical protein